MGPRVISGIHPAPHDGIKRRGNRDRRPTVVIVDSGADAEVLVFPPGECVGLGVEFHYRGTTWVVTGAGRDSGILVAEPSAH